MFESTISVLAWMSVILFQAVVHYHISGAHRRRGEEEAVVPALNEENEMKQSFSSTEIADDPMPHMMPYAVGEEEDEDESLDGDEPRMFFELLEQTGSEMMRLYYCGESSSGADLYGRRCGCVNFTELKNCVGASVCNTRKRSHPHIPKFYHWANR